MSHTPAADRRPGPGPAPLARPGVGRTTVQEPARAAGSRSPGRSTAGGGAHRHEAPSGRPFDANPIVGLQRDAGNRAVIELLRRAAGDRHARRWSPGSPGSSATVARGPATPGFHARARRPRPVRRPVRQLVPRPVRHPVRRGVWGPWPGTRPARRRRGRPARCPVRRRGRARRPARRPASSRPGRRPRRRTPTRCRPRPRSRASRPSTPS